MLPCSNGYGGLVQFFPRRESFVCILTLVRWCDGSPSSHQLHSAVTTHKHEPFMVHFLSLAICKISLLRTKIVFSQWPVGIQAPHKDMLEVYVLAKNTVHIHVELCKVRFETKTSFPRLKTNPWQLINYINYEIRKDSCKGKRPRLAFTVFFLPKWTHQQSTQWIGTWNNVSAKKCNGTAWLLKTT